MMKIFIGGLSQETSSKDIEDYFKQFGPCSNARIVCDRKTQTSKGYGFIEAIDSETYEKIISHKQHSIKNRKLDINRAVALNEDPCQELISKYKRKLYFIGVKKKTTEGQVHSYFSSFGAVSKVYLIYDPHTRISKNFGFVEFETEETASKVLEYNKHKILDKKILVYRHKNTGVFTSKGEMQPSREGSSAENEAKNKQKAGILTSVQAAGEFRRKQGKVYKVSPPKKKGPKKSSNMDSTALMTFLSMAYNFMAANSIPSTRFDGENKDEGFEDNRNNSLSNYSMHFGYSNQAPETQDSLNYKFNMESKASHWLRFTRLDSISLNQVRTPNNTFPHDI